MVVAGVETGWGRFHETFPARLLFDVIRLSFVNLLETLAKHVVCDAFLDFLVGDLSLCKLPQSLLLLLNLLLLVHRLIFVHNLLILILLFGLFFVLFHFCNAFFGLSDKFTLTLPRIVKFLEFGSQEDFKGIRLEFVKLISAASLCSKSSRLVLVFHIRIQLSLEVGKGQIACLPRCFSVNVISSVVLGEEND